VARLRDALGRKEVEVLAGSVPLMLRQSRWLFR